ncbi:hypothetical protein ATX68_09865 [Oenococcus oeni]|uniref:capsular polysaccharide synthesis protein n=1 Tax=Oenococcus oeni TaxID=1247 RepID=UPI00067B5B22|nr:capsular polysaccharide synthesis protein [Oenococcus oeni]KZD14622.1 putative capsular polysaccharide synthesis protein [Oenococcus oeni]OIM41553.1 hypothetical protein ATX68_09865 [Oenococcus oeni]OLQ43020.1 hypothetical protein ATX63_07580 [Oenococcus oeni]
MLINKIIKEYKKYGGSNLIKYYHDSHVLIYALSLAPFLIANKTGEELFREAISNKIQRKFYKKYLNYKIDSNLFKTDLVGKINTRIFNKRPIWFCWFQGIENAPKLVQVNYKNLQNKLGNERVILITADNFLNYVRIPKKIIIAWKARKITNTQFSDLLRAELLTENGGIWLDSTVYLSSLELPNYFDDSFFIYQSLKPGRNGLPLPISSWAIASDQNEALITRTRDLMFDYYLSGNKQTEYFLFHRFLMIAFKERPELAASIARVDNSQPHELLIQLQRSKNISLKTINKYLELSSLHKLTNKINGNNQEQNLKKIIKIIAKPLGLNNLG